VRTWLLTIARHRCLDHLRRSARQPWSLGREDDVREPLVADTEEVLVSDLLARRADIREGLAVLSESERAMVLLRFVGRAFTKMRDAIEGSAHAMSAVRPALTGVGGAVAHSLPLASSPPAMPAPPAQPAPSALAPAVAYPAPSAASPDAARPTGAPAPAPLSPALEVHAFAVTSVDESAALGALLLAVEAGVSTDAAFLERLSVQLRSPA